MRIYIDLDGINIDDVSKLYANIITRDDRYIGIGGDIKMWVIEKPESEVENDKRRSNQGIKRT